MLSKEEKFQLLNDIVENPEFKTTKTFNKLLTYLVESTINDVKIKEYSIAQEVFEKDPDFNPAEDSSVRVYISNLRKKLENYYNDIGKDSKYQIVIPKGKYEVEFQNAKHSERSTNYVKIGYKHLITYLSLAVIIVILSVLLLKSHFYVAAGEQSIKESKIWSDILTSENQVEVVVGDDLFFLEEPIVKDTTLENINDNEIIVRRHYVNTNEEFEIYKENHKYNDRIIKNRLTYTFFSLISVTSLPSISLLFDSRDDFHLQYSSNLHVNEILKNNIVFIGSFRTLYSLEQVLSDGKIKFKVRYAKSTIDVFDNDSTYHFEVVGEPDLEHVDYCLVRKIPGPNDNKIILFLSFSEAAMDAAISSMSDLEGLEKIEKLFESRYNEMPEYFDIIFKSSGFERTAFKTSIAYFDKIEPDSISLWGN
ncbi:MAG: helix-turn-helix domain-containing protein [Melioribacteraceae bacterium]|nr:helix-turn-helix domain-containing protein [Melioribacteraceae bacterium]MCF8265408.1 helix-turn-helix domain-containing protein [Melioribacteraceae bacterium]MCF8431562.1 helix-turn-helix domain-containing protein [Melioribacteraceae bacterium]